MNEIWNLPGSVQKTMSAATASKLLSENLECVEGVLGDDEIDAICAIVKESKAKAKSLSESGVKKSMVGVKTLPRDNDIELSDARLLYPPRGILGKDTVLFWRWTYKLELSAKGAKPFYSTKTWGGKDKYTEYGALIHVCKNAWKAFKADGGYDCPFGLDESFVLGG